MALQRRADVNAPEHSPPQALPAQCHFALQLHVRQITRAVSLKFLTRGGVPLRRVGFSQAGS